jgi:hypothetical protein
MPGIAELLAKVSELEAIMRCKLTPAQLEIVKQLISSAG